MIKHLMIVILIILLTGLIGCEIKTPEIRGVVLDAETKEPVEGAWVRATLEIKTRTVGGDVHTVLSLGPPHSRTNKQGQFVIPSKSFKKPAFPVGFGTEAVNVGIGASTVDDRGGRINFKEEKLKEFLGKSRVELIIYSTPIERTEGEYFTHLQSLYNYCLTGRSSVEIPSVEGGCDAWELDYVIRKHERYLERFKNPKIIENPPYGVNKLEEILHHSGIQQQLGDLLKKKGDYEKALNIIKRVKEFDKKYGLSLHLKDYENQINELQQLLRKNRGKIL